MSLPRHQTPQLGHISASQVRTPFTAVSSKTDIRLMHPASALSSNPGLETNRAHALEFLNSFLPNTRMRKGSVRCGLTAKVAVPWTWSWAVTANLLLAKEFLPSTPDSTLLFIPRLYSPPIKRGSTTFKEFSIRPPTRQLQQSLRKIDINYPSTLPRLSTWGNSTFSSAFPPASFRSVN
jgi:hypothetical protein